jgi:hypothetical protein
MLTESIVMLILMLIFQKKGATWVTRIIYTHSIESITFLGVSFFCATIKLKIETPKIEMHAPNRSNIVCYNCIERIRA